MNRFKNTNGIQSGQRIIKDTGAIVTVFGVYSDTEITLAIKNINIPNEEAKESTIVDIREYFYYEDVSLDITIDKFFQWYIGDNNICWQIFNSTLIDNYHALNYKNDGYLFFVLLGRNKDKKINITISRDLTEPFNNYTFDCKFTFSGYIFDVGIYTDVESTFPENVANLIKGYNPGISKWKFKTNG